jgi:hypothetical protein
VAEPLDKRTIDPVPFKALLKRWDGEKVDARVQEHEIPFMPVDEIKPKQA